jgi:hypothetical protein
MYFARGKIGDECLMIMMKRRFVSADEEYAAAMFLDVALTCRSLWLVAYFL